MDSPVWKSGKTVASVQWVSIQLDMSMISRYNVTVEINTDTIIVWIDEDPIFAVVDSSLSREPSPCIVRTEPVSTI